MPIRKALDSDVQVLTDLIRRAYLDVARRFGLTLENCPKHPSNCMPDWIQTSMDRGVEYFILEENGRAVGCVAVEQANPKVCYMERLAVVPEYRRAGHGRNLALHAIETARSKGANRMEIGIINEQTDLKKWYENLGFTYNRTARFDHLPFQVGFMHLDL